MQQGFREANSSLTVQDIPRKIIQPNLSHPVSLIAISIGLLTAPMAGSHIVVLSLLFCNSY